MKEVLWASLSESEVLHKLKAEKHTGLTWHEVDRRALSYGQNAIADEKPIRIWQLFFRQFASVMIYLLLAAAVISFVLEEHVDALVILIVILANVVIGFFQEYQAERSLRLLKKVMTFSAVVIRDGIRKEVPYEELVPGDIVELSLGARVPADMRLVAVHNLHINESVLTGESLPVEKTTLSLKTAVAVAEQKNMAFMGTVVVEGSGQGVVVATGSATQFGAIASMLQNTQKQLTPLQIKMQKLSQKLVVVIVGFTLLLFVVGIAVGYDVERMFTTSVALAVSALPEGLVIVMTVILAIGMKRILNRRALVRKLVAAEVLGSTNVICTDKTGTLTVGQMHVVRIVNYTTDHAVQHDGEPQKHPEAIFRLLRNSLLCSDAFIENPKDAFHEWRVFGNATECAIVRAASRVGLDRAEEEKHFSRVSSLPFESSRRYMLTVHNTAHGFSFCIVKGAPEVILEHAKHVEINDVPAPLNDERKARIKHLYQTLSSQGLRVIAVAYRQVAHQPVDPKDPELFSDMVFQGLIGLQDPLRTDAKAMIKETKEAGIRTIMLTGDNRLTAQSIAQALGLPAKNENILDGESLEHLTPEQLESRIAHISVYARVTPKDKLRIISAWQKKGAVVAMTGDGVNDAPALKAANIGIALGSGTDVAKETAEIVLLDNTFSVIVHAVEEGRVIYMNIKKVVLYLVSDSFTEVLLISLSLLFGLPLPLVATQILWTNLVSDVLPALALTSEPKEKDVMRQPPIPRNEPIFTKKMQQAIIWVSIFTGVAAFALFIIYLQLTGDLIRARSVTFLAVTIDSLFYICSVRSINSPIWRSSLFTNKWLLVSVGCALILQLAAMYFVPLSTILSTVKPHLVDWIPVLVFSVIGTLIFEYIKGSFSKNKTEFSL